MYTLHRVTRHSSHSLMIRIAILGSTGSIGRSTLEVVAQHPDRFEVVGLAAHSRIDVLAEQVRTFAPSAIVVWDEDRAEEFRRQTSQDTVASGLAGLIALATHPEVDCVVIATSGRDALLPLVRASLERTFSHGRIAYHATCRGARCNAYPNRQ
jgi:1-deoxy-D-xylulose-5-phosphate reductoisomerase